MDITRKPQSNKRTCQFSKTAKAEIEIIVHIHTIDIAFVFHPTPLRSWKRLR